LDSRREALKSEGRQRRFWNLIWVAASVTNNDFQLGLDNTLEVQQTFTSIVLYSLQTSWKE